MKKLMLILLIASVLINCKSSEKFLKEGNYDAAVRTAVKKLRQSPDSRENLDILSKAYPLANQKDLERIKFLKLEGKSAGWDEIFRLYSSLKDRQDLVKSLIPILPERTFYFEEVDYNQDIIESKEKAAESIYAQVATLMKSEEQEPNRKAYTELQRLNSFYPNYKDVDQLITTAKRKGTTYVLVTVESKSNVKIDERFKRNVLSFGNEDLNKEWIEYFIQPIKDNNYYDYTALVNFKLIDFSPEQVKESRFTEKKSVRDGWEYEYDTKGNVKKDSAGNDVKKPKYRNITCEVIEKKQLKTAHFEGSIDYINTRTKQIVKSVPFANDHVFDHAYCTINGDKNALTEETAKRVGGAPISFPSNTDMVFQASEHLKNQIFALLKENKYLIK